MRIRFIDAYSSARRYNVGDIFSDGDNYSCDEKIQEEFSDLKFEVNSGGDIQVYKRDGGRRVCGWSLYCQDVFLIVNRESNKILFTSKNYSRDARGRNTCPFYGELRAALEQGFEEESKFQLSTEVEFMDI